MINALFKTYFEEEGDVGDVDTLVAAAEAAGLDGSAAREFLASDTGPKEVVQEVQRFMQSYRVSGVPFYLVQLQGRGGSSVPAGEDAPTAQGTTCGPEGCPAPSAAGSSEAEVKDLTGVFGASGAQEVEYFTKLLAHMEEEAAKVSA